jgi:hypothetical protein
MAIKTTNQMPARVIAFQLENFVPGIWKFRGAASNIFRN